MNCKLIRGSVKFAVQIVCQLQEDTSNSLTLIPDGILGGVDLRPLVLFDPGQRCRSSSLRSLAGSITVWLLATGAPLPFLGRTSFVAEYRKKTRHVNISVTLVLNLHDNARHTVSPPMTLKPSCMKPQSNFQTTARPHYLKHYHAEDHRHISSIFGSTEAPKSKSMHLQNLRSLFFFNCTVLFCQTIQVGSR